MKITISANQIALHVIDNASIELTSVSLDWSKYSNHHSSPSFEYDVELTEDLEIELEDVVSVDDYNLVICDLKCMQTELDKVQTELDKLKLENQQLTQKKKWFFNKG